MTEEDYTNLRSYFDLSISKLIEKGYNPVCYDMIAKDIRYHDKVYDSNNSEKSFCYICFKQSKVDLLNDGFRIPKGFTIEENNDNNIPYSTCIKRFYNIHEDYSEIVGVIFDIDLTTCTMLESRSRQGG